MARTTTTLSGAVAVADNTIKVASAAGFAVNNVIFCDGEQMLVSKAWDGSSTTVNVLRGQGGTVTQAHQSGANVTTELGSDTGDPSPGWSPVNFPNVRSRTVTSYTAAGAIALPVPGNDAVAIINGTSTIAMTVAAPTKDLDGCILFIMGNGKSASSVTFASGIGNAGSSYDAITFQNAGDVGLSVMAINGFWNLLNGPITGTSTALSVAIA